MVQNPIITFFILSLLIHPSTITAGVTYSYSVAGNHPPPDILPSVELLDITRPVFPAASNYNAPATFHTLFPNVDLYDTTTQVSPELSYADLILTVPNYLVGSFASNGSFVNLWVYDNVVPFHPRARISLISIGSNIMSLASSGGISDFSTALVPAMKNLHDALTDLGIETVSVSTTFSFLTTSFPPSAAELTDYVRSPIMRPVLEFLLETNSSFLMSPYPYNVFRLHRAIPVDFGSMHQSPSIFHDDADVVDRYNDAFDKMVDIWLAALKSAGYQPIPLIVIETGGLVRRQNQSEVKSIKDDVDDFISDRNSLPEYGVGDEPWADNSTLSNSTNSTANPPWNVTFTFNVTLNVTFNIGGDDQKNGSCVPPPPIPLTLVPHNCSILVIFLILWFFSLIFFIIFFYFFSVFSIIFFAIIVFVLCGGWLTGHII